MPVIFDMDGVLFDSEPLHLRAWQQVVAPLGHDLPDAWFLPWVGVTDRTLAEYFHSEYHIDIPANELLLQKRERYQAITMQHLRPFAGVIEGLRQLAAYSIPVAVATSSSRSDAHHTLSCTGLAAFFSVLVTGNDVQRHKPAPDPFLKAADLLNTYPAKCIVIEDSHIGIQAAREAGCTVLAVTTTYQAAELNQAHHIFPATAEAVRWVLAGEMATA